MPQPDQPGPNQPTGCSSPVFYRSPTISSAHHQDALSAVRPVQNPDGLFRGRDKALAADDLSNPPVADDRNHDDSANMSARLLTVKPIYGYGWSGAVSGCTRDTPLPFSARVTGAPDTGWTGNVEMSGHEFDGQAISLTKRHILFDGVVNVEIEGLATGWASVA